MSAVTERAADVGAAACQPRRRLGANKYLLTDLEVVQERNSICVEDKHQAAGKTPCGFHYALKSSASVADNSRSKMARHRPLSSSALAVTSQRHRLSDTDL